VVSYLEESEGGGSGEVGATELQRKCKRSVEDGGRRAVTVEEKGGEGLGATGGED